MKLLGIIAEYNPFHLGHAYQIQTAREALAPDGVIAVMSGHFTQRGQGALADKWQRAKWAVQAGCDLVLELPACFCTRSANYFALGGVLTLAHAGATHLVFGAEDDDLATLSQAAAILADEPTAYQQILRQNLAGGSSYPQAQAAALTHYLPQSQQLWQPNNLLALNYLQIIYRENLPLVPYPIKRQGSYHSLQAQNGLASASAIRQMLAQNDPAASRYLPAPVAQSLPKQLIFAEDFAAITLALLRRASAYDLQQIIEMNEGLEYRLQKAAQTARSLDDLCRQAQSKRYPYSRISRLLCHILLNFTTRYERRAPEYLRVLAFNATGSKILKALKPTATLPIITKTAAAAKKLSPSAQEQLALDIRATDLYHLAYTDPQAAQGGWDYYRGPVILA